jgi:hypothetical protein
VGDGGFCFHGHRLGMPSVNVKECLKEIPTKNTKIKASLLLKTYIPEQLPCVPSGNE